jgi:hypothetical protein
MYHPGRLSNTAMDQTPCEPLASSAAQVIADASAGQHMAEGTRPGLSDFPLLRRWNRDTHAKLSPDELESIRPLPEDEAAVLCYETLMSRLRVK